MREPDYDINGLQSSIEHCKKNIDLYNQAIADQQTQIANYRKMIETLQTKQKLAEGVVLDAKTGQQVNADTDDQ